MNLSNWYNSTLKGIVLGLGSSYFLTHENKVTEVKTACRFPREDNPGELEIEIELEKGEKFCLRMKGEKVIACQIPQSPSFASIILDSIGARSPKTGEYFPQALPTEVNEKVGLPLYSQLKE